MGSNEQVKTDAILESISDGVFTVDKQWRITSFNRAAEEITGVPRSEAIGQQCSNVFRASMCEMNCALRRTMESGDPLINQPAYIIDSDGHRVPITVSTALLRDGKGHVIGGAETFRDLSDVEDLRKELQARYRVGDLISRSSAMHAIFEILPTVAASPTTVLIQGATGTGKELLARALHAHSGRADAPFTAINCGALPDNLLESELFGYVAGAFTGANQDRAGRIAAAEGGTLFLDEIGEISHAMQVKLLRFLQERTYEPLGSNETRRADVRVIAATNRDLVEEVGSGSFRQDLYYRIKVIQLQLPPLRERREDIPLLIKHFVDRFNSLQGRAIAGISEECIAVLMAHDWPGNIRELENAIEHAFVLCPGDRIQLQHLPAEFQAATSTTADSLGLKDAEAIAIRGALERNNFNRKAAAEALGIHTSTLFRKMKALGIAFPDRDGRNR